MPFVWLDGFPFMTTFDFFHAQKCEFQILDLQLMTHVWPPQQKKGWPHTHTGHPIQKFAKTINLPKFNVFHWKVTTDDMQVGGTRVQFFKKCAKQSDFEFSRYFINHASALTYNLKQK